ncbi:hypothetical protein FISHEDRAFT_76109 [Fistulina hepatica ATCC 64428]|uniref:Uncharacterized protein n=1 Tax=Fistulina hepatica ATCC 64428 TaxID=1128425 RepID=A0A0D7A678_9AGAR|nr:hypothetical protein FISHEDRAFT_76109 [Fistulina hepatica ATCC 64428]
MLTDHDGVLLARESRGRPSLSLRLDVLDSNAGVLMASLPSGSQPLIQFTMEDLLVSTSPLMIPELTRSGTLEPGALRDSYDSLLSVSLHEACTSQLQRRPHIRRGATNHARPLPQPPLSTSSGLEVEQTITGLPRTSSSLVLRGDRPLRSLDNLHSQSHRIHGPRFSRNREVTPTLSSRFQTFPCHSSKSKFAIKGCLPDLTISRRKHKIPITILPISQSSGDVRRLPPPPKAIRARMLVHR